MPNWCSNTLEVCGEPELLGKFLEECRKYPEYYYTTGYVEKVLYNSDPIFTFEGIVPKPEELARSIAENFGERNRQWKSGECDPTKYDSAKAEAWYDWNINNWGTKWDAVVVEETETEEEDFFSIVFETAWGPPVDWLKAASKKYPGLAFTLEYEESGMMFHESLKYHQGKCLEHTIFDYPEDVEEGEEEDETND